MICATCFFWLQLGRVRRSWDTESVRTLVHAFITSRINYCNTVLASAPKYVTDKLHRVLNAAARLVSDTKKFDRGLSRLLYTDLHWLDVPDRVQFKLCMTVRRCMQDKAPQYLKENCISFSDSDSRQRLRSFCATSSSNFWPSGLRCCMVRRRGTLNSLPDDLHNLSCCDSYFRRFLKSILFSFYYIAHSALEVF